MRAMITLKKCNAYLISVVTMWVLYRLLELPAFIKLPYAESDHDVVHVSPLELILAHFHISSELRPQMHAILPIFLEYIKDLSRLKDPDLAVRLLNCQTAQYKPRIIEMSVNPRLPESVCPLYFYGHDESNIPIETFLEMGMDANCNIFRPARAFLSMLVIKILQAKITFHAHAFLACLRSSLNIKLNIGIIEPSSEVSYMEKGIPLLTAIDAGIRVSGEPLQMYGERTKTINSESMKSISTRMPHTYF